MNEEIILVPAVSWLSLKEYNYLLPTKRYVILSKSFTKGIKVGFFTTSINISKNPKISLPTEREKKLIWSHLGKKRYNILKWK
jgi:hypothetical protein